MTKLQGLTTVVGQLAELCIQTHSLSNNHLSTRGGWGVLPVENQEKEQNEVPHV